MFTQDEGVVMGTVRRDLRDPAGLPDSVCISGEPVHQGAAGMQHNTLKNTLLILLEKNNAVIVLRGSSTVEKKQLYLFMLNISNSQSQHSICPFCVNKKNNR